MTALLVGFCVCNGVVMVEGLSIPVRAGGVNKPKPRLKTDIFRQPIRYGIEHPQVETIDVNIYALQIKDPLKESPNKTLLHAAKINQKRADLKKWGNRSISAGIIAEGVLPEALHKRTNNVFKYVFTPDKTRASGNLHVQDVVKLIAHIKQQSKDKDLNIGRVIVHGQKFNAFELAQLLHLTGAVEKERGGRPIIYKHYVASNKDADAKQAAYFPKKVTFTRVDPETGALVFRGTPHFYEQILVGQDVLKLQNIDGNTDTIYSGFVPLDHIHNRDAYDAMKRRPKLPEEFKRLVFSTEPVGAEKRLRTPEESNTDGEGSD